MELVKKKPVTNGTRHQINIKKSLLSKSNRTVKFLLKGIKIQFGRSKQTGQITSRHKGGIKKNIFRKINFNNDNYTGLVLGVSYDSFRNAFINLNFNFINKSFFYTLNTNGTYPGSWVINSLNISYFKIGYRTNIKKIYPGTIINNISIDIKKKSQYIRSAGSKGQLLQLRNKKAKIRLPSNQFLEINYNGYATLGAISNKKYHLNYIGKSGRNRRKGKRPSVRGIAMNPVDHPHGGRSNGGRPSVTPWGLPTKSGFYLKKKVKKYKLKK